jgi:ABC-type multidrug transport system ATPase subunit
MANLVDRGDDLVGSYSRGMRQRLAVERALIHDPRLMLLDEPFTGLDDASREALRERLRMARAAGTIVILTTHDIAAIENLTDLRVTLVEGRLAA